MNLTIENCAGFVRSSTPETVKEAVRELYQAEDAAKAALREKCAAYFASKDERYKRIVEQIASVDAQRQAVEAEKAQHSKALVEATLSGDSTTIQRVQGELARCEAEIASFNGQTEMYTAYELTGDPALYAEIVQDHAALLELISVNSQIRDAMYQITEQIKNAWASAVYPENRKAWVSGNFREPWQADVEKVQADQQETPETVGARLNTKAAADKAAAAEQQRRASIPSVVFPGH